MSQDSADIDADALMNSDEEEEDDEEEVDPKVMSKKAIYKIQPQLEEFYEQYPFYPKASYMDKMRARLTKYVDPANEKKRKPIPTGSRDPKKFLDNFKTHLRAAPLCKKALELGSRVEHGNEVNVARDSQDKVATRFFAAYDALQEKLASGRKPGGKQPGAGTLIKDAEKLIKNAEALLNKATVSAKRQPKAKAKPAPKRKREELVVDEAPVKQPKQQEEVVPVEVNGVPPETVVVFDNLGKRPDVVTVIEQGFGNVCLVLQQQNEKLDRLWQRLAPPEQHGYQTVVREYGSTTEVTSTQLFPTREEAKAHIAKRWPEGVEWSDIRYA